MKALSEKEIRDTLTRRPEILDLFVKLFALPEDRQKEAMNEIMDFINSRSAEA